MVQAYLRIVVSFTTLLNQSDPESQPGVEENITDHTRFCELIRSICCVAVRQLEPTINVNGKSGSNESVKAHLQFLILHNIPHYIPLTNTLITFVAYRKAEIKHLSFITKLQQF